jgi:glyoxylase-like metal-dependent hydrolase (beta-lactamase superfamily II)
VEPKSRLPTLAPVGDAITAIDTIMTGEPELNAVYLVEASEPALVEAGPGADHDVIVDALTRLGIGPADLAHIVVTHIHVDHAGGAGALTDTFPAATVWAHDRGVPHLVDPTRLIASTARTYGPKRMEAFYGRTLPVPAARLRAVSDGDSIHLGSRSLEVIGTPGHASHHVALQDSVNGATFTGEAIGSYLPWADCYRPALPPPEVDVELALGSVERIRGSSPTTLLTSHFGAVTEPEEACERATQRIRDWSETVRRTLRSDPQTEMDELARILGERATRELLRDSGQESVKPIDLARYDVLGSIAMNASGLSRYWRKRWEREAADRAADS